MNQTRTFLIFAWLMVATLLFMAWSREQAPQTSTPARTDVAAVATTTGGDSTVPSLAKNAPPQVPAAVPSSPQVPATTVARQGGGVTVTTDVLRLEMDGGAVRQADLLGYPQTTEPGSLPVRLFAADPATWYQAQSGWVSDDGNAPSHETGFVTATSVRDYTLAAGNDSLQVPFVWHRQQA